MNTASAEAIDRALAMTDHEMREMIRTWILMGKLFNMSLAPASTVDLMLARLNAQSEEIERLR